MYVVELLRWAFIRVILRFPWCLQMKKKMNSVMMWEWHYVYQSLVFWLILLHILLIQFELLLIIHLQSLLYRKFVQRMKQAKMWDLMKKVSTNLFFFILTKYLPVLINVIHFSLLLGYVFTIKEQNKQILALLTQIQPDKLIQQIFLVICLLNHMMTLKNLKNI